MVQNQNIIASSKPNTKIIGKTVLWIVLLSLSFLIMVPFLWMLSSSIKMDNEVFSVPIQWFPTKPQWSNYIEIWKQIPFVTFYKNTAKLTLIVTLLQLFTSSLASYGFAKMKFPGRNALFVGYIATIAVPWQVYMVPQYIMMKKVNLVDTHMSIILLQAFTAFGVFLLRQFYMSIPEELSEAARIDGLNEYGIYFRMILPLSKPSLATLTIFTFVNTWNDFMGPFIYLNSTKLKTIQLGLRMFISQFEAQYGLIMAASVVAVVPVVILFLFTQRFFIEGIATSGLKG
jgi:multiple sugar transport system permease protein